MVFIRTTYWTLYLDMQCTTRAEKEACPMIFRHFLSPATGCASYVFG
jgi:hypothetical protein